jgi:hypothetical protein
VVHNRAIRIIAAALAACVVASIAASALGFLFLTGLMLVLMPQSEWAGILVGGFLVVVFGLTFVVCFREMLGKLTPQ